MRYRWKLMILLLCIAIVPGMIARTLGVRSVRKLGAVLIANSRQNLLTDMENRMQILVESHSTILWKGREQIEMALLFQASEVERALADPEPRPPGKTYFSEDFNEGRDVPPDTVLSSYHFRTRPSETFELLRVSHTHQVFKLAPGVKRSSVNGDIARLHTLTPVYQKLSSRLKGLIWWQNTSLANGLHSSYPGHNGIPKRLDARALSWYEQGLKNSMPWSDPYVDPETRQIVVAGIMPVKKPGGDTAGVTAIVVPVSSLLDRRLLFKNMPPKTKFFMCYLAENPETRQTGARIFAHEDHIDVVHRSWRIELDQDWLSGGDPIQFREMINDFQLGIGNSRRMSYGGIDSLWVYGATRSGAFLVLITPYEEILKPAAEAESYIDGLINDLIASVGYIGFSVVALVVVLSLTFSRTVTRPIRTLAEGARELAEGNFEAQVDIRSHDEFGEMGRVFNRVGPQLREHYQIRHSLELAMEIQQNLLPKADPKVEGLDVAGTSIYCEKTGGDYYDYLERPVDDGKRLSVVVGDVSDHGIPSALLMTTVRALLRQCSSRLEEIHEIVTDVNRQLTHDIGESGQFMTLFYCEIDSGERRIRWVRAGHDPAFLYDPGIGTFRVLRGSGVALGVSGDVLYEASQQQIGSGQILLIGTDGIWESRNAEGEMFGKETLKRVVRQNAGLPAKGIVGSVMGVLRDFQHPLEPEDDATLVVVKID